MKSLRLGILAAVSLLASTIGAFADPATVTAHVNVRSGPGVSYAPVGKIMRNTVVEIVRCQGDWCQITSYGLSGWVSSQYLVDAPLPSDPRPQPDRPGPGPQWPQPDRPGPGPQWPQPDRPGPGPQWPQPDRPGPRPQWPQPQPPRPPAPTPVPIPDEERAEACFYAERNFGGASFCLEQGEELARFRTWDDRIRSVEIFGGAEVDLCSDRNLYGACVTLRKDTPRLPPEIDRRASSVEVY